MSHLSAGLRHRVVPSGVLYSKGAVGSTAYSLVLSFQQHLCLWWHCASMSVSLLGICFTSSRKGSRLQLVNARSLGSSRH